MQYQQKRWRDIVALPFWVHDVRDGPYIEYWLVYEVGVPQSYENMKTIGDDEFAERYGYSSIADTTEPR